MHRAAGLRRKARADSFGDASDSQARVRARTIQSTTRQYATRAAHRKRNTLPLQAQTQTKRNRPTRRHNANRAYTSSAYAKTRLRLAAARRAESAQCET